MEKSRLHIDKELYKKAKYNNYSKLQQIYWKTKRTIGNIKIARHAKENTNALKSNNALAFDKNL